MAFHAASDHIKGHNLSRLRLHLREPPPRLHDRERNHNGLPAGAVRITAVLQ